MNRTRERSEEERDALSAAAKRRNEARYFRLRWTPANGGWAEKELALLGTDDDDAIAKKLGRTVASVRAKRTRLEIAVFRDRRPRSRTQ